MKEPTDPYLRAKKKVKAKKGFYSHLAAYIVVNVFMFILVFYNEGSFGWLIPMSGWGIGLAMHYFGVFGFPGSGLGSMDWEDREIKKELEKEGYDLEDFKQKEELELKEIEKVRKEWKDDDLV